VTLHIQQRADLPVQLTSFIGREHELAEARRLLAATRLLTLSGPGGSGKTRLSIQLASSVALDFGDGVYFASLAPITDPRLVLPSIAVLIGLHDARKGSLLDHIAAHLRERRTLLILDNFEHLLPAAPSVAEILRKTLTLKIVVTSRASLRISGEQEFAVPPLGLPDPTLQPRSATVGTAESVKLFVERARAFLPEFAVEDTNAACLAQIVRRLDGLPLAIELAAARVKLLPPQAMLPRLEHSLGLLVVGARDLPDRQQTLRATIAWSYGLLSPHARRILAACSVFRGGASLERIESVCIKAGFSDRQSVLGDLHEVVDQNLLRRVETRAGSRLNMLETIREFASERLAELPEEHRLRETHAAEFRSLVDEAPRRLTGPDEKDWLDLLDAEHNNIRVAMGFYLREIPTVALQMAIAMRPFWSARGHFTEGRQQLRKVLEQIPETDPNRARALSSAAWLAVDQGDYTDAQALLDESIRLSCAAGDELGVAISTAHLGRSRIASGHAADAVSSLEAALPVLRARAHPPDLGVGLLYWGLVALFVDQPAIARERLEEGVALCREIGFRSLGARALYLLGLAHIELSDLDGGRRALEDALPTSLELGDYWVIAQQIGAFAGLAAKMGRPREAMQLAGFQAAFSRTHEFSVPIVLRTMFESWLLPAKRALGADAASWSADGEKWTLDEAVACAMSAVSVPKQRGRLTQRELEVAQLVAGGLSNREIAGALTLSVRTVEVHVDHILTKLDLNSRTRLAAWMHASKSDMTDT